MKRSLGWSAAQRRKVLILLAEAVEILEDNNHPIVKPVKEKLQELVKNNKGTDN